LWKALITGPKGTPYEGGCFLFDIYFPSDYPGRAPSVKLRTTGGGTVRFNPNLYNCGKVCLSLLGTWQGEKGESWSAEYSSILQVLVSIQSLIFVDQPFYNEPGYESRPDDSQSNAYSAQIMEMTVKWAMIDQLKSPPEYFADAIRYHFRERGEVVVATVKRWEEWCRSIGASKSAAGIKKMLPELESEILKLKHE
jgi:baculoviral IAP repeat-containing protein 6